VIAPAGQGDEADIGSQQTASAALGMRPARGGRRTRLILTPFADQIWVFGVMHDQRVEIPGIVSVRASPGHW